MQPGSSKALQPFLRRFGILGLVTGIWWSKFTWYVGTDVWWNFDPRQTMAALQLLIYGAYFVLRSAVDEPERRSRIAAVYNLSPW